MRGTKHSSIASLVNGKSRQSSADPPYGMKVSRIKAGFGNLNVPKAILNDDITGEAPVRTIHESLDRADPPHLERKNAFYIFNSDLMIFAFREGMRKSGLTSPQFLIWVKTHAADRAEGLPPQFELIAYGWYGAS